MCCQSRCNLARLGILCGLVALATLLSADISGSWLYTKEPIKLPNSAIITSISFRIGLWRVCPSVRRPNATTQSPLPACFLVKYTNWSDVAYSDLGVWAPLELAQVFVTRMRYCAVLIGCATVVLVIANLFALIGQCKENNKTILACGCFILSGLCLGTGLVVFVSALSETLMEIAQYRKPPPSGPSYDYRYGWCFFTAGVAFIMTKMAAFLSLSGHLHRFSSVDEMVCKMVPGAERKLRDHHKLLTKLVTQPVILPPPREFYDGHVTEQSQTTTESDGPLIASKTPPDVCTSNTCVEFAAAAAAAASAAATSAGEGASTSAPPHGTAGEGRPGAVVGQLAPAAAGTLERSGYGLAGQTVPITVKNFNAPSSTGCKYGTMPAPKVFHNVQHQLEAAAMPADISHTMCRSRTLQHPQQQQQQQRPKKKCVKIESFEASDVGFTDFGKRSSVYGYSGSAV